MRLVDSSDQVELMNAQLLKSQAQFGPEVDVWLDLTEVRRGG